MDAQLIATRINAASALKTGALRFWGEWFGKPYDNAHKIIACSAAGKILRLDFQNGETLTIAAPEDLDLSANTFSIRDAAAVRWEWFYYGKPQISENLYFYDFRRSGACIESKTNVDWYKPILSPKGTYNAVEIL